MKIIQLNLEDKKTAYAVHFFKQKRFYLIKTSHLVPNCSFRVHSDPTAARQVDGGPLELRCTLQPSELSSSQHGSRSERQSDFELSGCCQEDIKDGVWSLSPRDAVKR